MFAFDLKAIEKPRVLKKAEGYLAEEPRTVTADRCERSPGGLHDYYSEGGYWWPNPEDPGGPYIRRDGETNPDLFYAHRHSMVRLGEIMGTLTSAYLLTRDEQFAQRAAAHLRAWFVDEQTRMNPSLLYGQAIFGRRTGRGIGIIDTLHLAEVARGAKLLASSDALAADDQAAIAAWFGQYLHWMNTHEYGQAEKYFGNNHSICWALQAAVYADLIGDAEQIAWVRERFKAVFLGEMMNLEGGFPKELARTKPYGYSLFVIDVMAGIAQVASTADDDLWVFELPDGRGMRKGLSFIAPFIEDKGRWPKAPDVMYWEDWPVRHPCLLFAGLRFDEPPYLELWRKLEPDPEPFEVIRNFPLRHPLLWCDSR